MQHFYLRDEEVTVAGGGALDGPAAGDADVTDAPGSADHAADEDDQGSTFSMVTSPGSGWACRIWVGGTPDTPVPLI